MEKLYNTLVYTTTTTTTKRTSLRQHLFIAKDEVITIGQIIHCTCLRTRSA